MLAKLDIFSETAKCSSINSEMGRDISWVDGDADWVTQQSADRLTEWKWNSIFRDKTPSTFCCIPESEEDSWKAKAVLEDTENRRENVISVRCKVENGTFMRWKRWFDKVRKALWAKIL